MYHETTFHTTYNMQSLRHKVFLPIQAAIYFLPNTLNCVILFYLQAVSTVCGRNREIPIRAGTVCKTGKTYGRKLVKRQHFHKPNIQNFVIG